MIGKIEKIPLRDIWKHEAKDFTTWLEANIDVLNDVLDFQLNTPEREKSTGNFSVDLVSEDENGNIVVIENQLEKSNHDHLGKVITYLAAVGAAKAIWIVSEPRPEHVKAISWLNESVNADFYILKIEGIKIGDSQPAPLLTQIVGPSREVKEASQTKKEYKERHFLRKEFWDFLLEEVKSRTTLHANISSGIYSWLGTGAGISGISYNYVIGQHDAKIELYIDKDKEDGKENKIIFDKLYSQKEQIESDFGGELNWERLENKRASRISKHFKLGGYRDKEKWKRICNDMIDGMINLEKALSKRIEKIK